MAVQFQNYYEILGVARTAAPDEIKKAFRKLAMIHHPDVARNKVDGANKFREIREAYEVLSDPTRRRRFDELDANWKRGGASPTRHTRTTRTARPARPAPEPSPRSAPQPEPEPSTADFSDFFKAYFAHAPADDRPSLFREAAPFSPDAQDPQAPRKSARWFYRTASGQAQGPFDFVELAALLRCGDITGATLTRSDGDKGDAWMPFHKRHQFGWARDMPPEVIYRNLEAKTAGPKAPLFSPWIKVRYFFSVLLCVSVIAGIMIFILGNSPSGNFGSLVSRILFLFFR